MPTIFRHIGRALNYTRHLRAMASSSAGASGTGTIGKGSSASSPHGASGGGSGTPLDTKFNRLAKEKSPYLLQHATNPVNWYPWGEEAFKAAAAENKLIFLSVGYSTCHWCHVMERESFESEKVADIMNRHFINVKVDREERPDVDKVYMTFVTSMSGSGGWPMSVWLTPDLHPVYGGTYFPPTNRYYGRPGFPTILEALAKQWATDEAKVRKSGSAIVSVLQKNVALPKPDADEDGDGSSRDGDILPPGQSAGKCLAQLSRSYEPQYGGFSEAPKFPQPSNFNFLFAYYQLNPRLDDAKKGKDMALHSLRMMARGGIHDHVAQGFARYSTDKSWHVPHFEKMLYDQAQLVHAYLDAFLVSRQQEYEDVVRDILEYVMRDLSHESGGFYSAEDADSLPSADSTEKKEGAFCVWTHKEIHTTLAGLSVQESSTSPSLAELFCHHYSVVETGNVDPYKDPHDELKNQNVLMEHGSLAETAQEFSLSETEVKRGLATAREKLYQRRQTRPRPHLDDKMLTAWNGMMLSAISCAGAVLTEPRYLERAEAAERFMAEHLTEASTGELYRAAYRGQQGEVTPGPQRIPGFCDDYAWSVRGLLTLYEVTLQQRHLARAEQLQDMQDKLFWDNTDGGYYTTRQGDASILLRMKDDHDGAEPSVNSVSAGNLLRLSRLLEQPEQEKKCKAILRLFADRLTKIPVALPELATVQLMAECPTTQVILSGDPQSATMRELVKVVHSFPSPNRVLLVASQDEKEPLYTHQPSLLNYKPQPTRRQAGAKDDDTSSSDEEEDKGKKGDGDKGSKGVDNSAKVAVGLLQSEGVLVTARAYVCHNFVCSLPMSKPEQLRKNLEKSFATASAATGSG